MLVREIERERERQDKLLILEWFHGEWLSLSWKLEIMVPNIGQKFGKKRAVEERPD